MARRYELIPSELEYEDGFGWQTIWASLFVGFIMLPGAIYLGLVTGQSIAGASDWVTIILYLEIAKRTLKRLKPQQLIIMYWLAAGLIGIGVKLRGGATLFGGPFGGLIWDQYFVSSDEARDIARLIPQWVVPPKGSEPLIGRTFWHSAWLKPIGILFAVMVLANLNRLSLGYVLFRLTGDVEGLPFPLAPVHAGSATALAESSAREEGWRWRVFSIGSIIGLGFGTIYIGVPVLSSIFLTKTVTILEIPFIDLTQHTSSVLPASPIAIGTDLGAVFLGFVLPFWVCVGMFSSAFLSTFVVTPLLYRYGVLVNWSEGMTYIPTVVMNSFDLWISFGIGTSMVVLVAGIVTTVKAVRQTGVRARARRPPESRGDISTVIPIALWFLGAAGFVGLCYILVPEFPWWISAVFGFVWTPINSYINARMIGITGGSGSVHIPYLREATFYLSGYNKGVDVWFAPIPLHDHSQAVNAFKQLELTRTKFKSIVKLTILTTFVMWICSFIFWSWIWKLEKIPSSSYPFVQRMWPMYAQFQAIWCRTTLPGGKGMEFLKEIIHPQYIGAGFAVGGAIYLVCSAVGLPVLFFYGVLTGLGRQAFMSFPVFFGSMLGRYYLKKKLGEERWGAYAPILLGGFGCGTGLVGMTSIALKLITTAVTPTVF